MSAHGGDEDEDMECPLCLEPLDITDRNFRPCKCGYQICLWCYHSITDRGNKCCPACRTTYSPSAIEGITLDEDTIKAMRKQSKKHQESNSGSAGSGAGAGGTGSAGGRNRSGDSSSKEDLASTRILQRSLLYVVGLSPNLAKEEVLRKKEMFGRFGKIIKIAINRKQNHPAPPNPSYSAYITYRHASEAKAAIDAVNGVMMDGRIVRATYGTTKYCSYFLRGLTCTNTQCLYLHEFADPADCYSKEELAASDRFSSDFVNASSERGMAAAAAAATATTAGTGTGPAAGAGGHHHYHHSSSGGSGSSMHPPTLLSSSSVPAGKSSAAGSSSVVWGRQASTGGSSANQSAAGASSNTPSKPMNPWNIRPPTSGHTPPTESPAPLARATSLATGEITAAARLAQANAQAEKGTTHFPPLGSTPTHAKYAAVVAGDKASGEKGKDAGTTTTSPSTTPQTSSGVNKVTEGLSELSLRDSTFPLPAKRQQETKHAHHQQSQSQHQSQLETKSVSTVAVQSKPDAAQSTASQAASATGSKVDDDVPASWEDTLSEVEDSKAADTPVPAQATAEEKNQDGAGSPPNTADKTNAANTSTQQAGTTLDFAALSAVSSNPYALLGLPQQTLGFPAKQPVAPL